MPDRHTQGTAFWGPPGASGGQHFVRRCDRVRRDQIYHMGPTYCPCGDYIRTRYQCFECRRMFKQNVRADKLYIQGSVTQDWIFIRQNFGKKPPTTRQETYTLHPLHCPGCGNPGRRVDGSLKVPSRQKKKAWEDIRMRLQNGTKFNNCRLATEELRLGISLLARRLPSECEARVDEKRKRITVLQKAVKLGVRTSEEERRLKVIRAARGKFESTESWVVVNT